MINQYLLGWFTLIVVIFITLLIIKKNPITKNFLIVALFLRSLTTILGEFYITLPGTGMDTYTYEQFAFTYSQTYKYNIISQFLTGDSYFLSKFISIFYTIFDRSPMMANMLSVGFGIGSVFLIYRLTLILWGNNTAVKAGWFVALFPSFILYSSILMREVYVIFFLTYALITCIHFIDTNRFIYFVKAFFGFFLSALFHGPIILGFFIFLIFLFFKILKENHYFIRFSKRKIYLIFILPLILIPFVTYYLGYYSIPKLGSMKDFGYIKKDNLRYMTNSKQPELKSFGQKIIWKVNKAASVCHFEKCEASYPSSTVPKDMIEMMYLTPIRMFYFLYAPFPWDIKSPKHLIGLFDAIFYIYLSICVFRNRKNLYENPKTRFLIFILISYIFVYSFGVGNFGTGIRHRLKFLVILIAIAAPKLKKIKF